MPRLPKHPAVWFGSLAGWFGLLWFLSSMSGVGGGPQIPHLDKVAHFVYFLAGGFLFSGWILKLRPAAPDWRKIMLFTVCAMALTGGLDEWHQCYTPGRSGADPWDWLADVLGGAAGGLVCKTLHRILR